MTHPSMKRTPLYEEHLRLGAKMVEFAGWEMPVQYEGVIREHQAVRAAVGIFDVSHMGEIWVSGPEAQAALENLTCNNVAKLYDGKAQYSALLNHAGGVVDDVIVYRVTAERFLVCVNASNAEKDFEWMRAHNTTSAEIVNASSEWGQIAVQGPRAIKLVAQLLPNVDIAGLKSFHFVQAALLGVEVIVARTGYTGEDGVEIFVPAQRTVDLWRLLLEHGAQEGVVPCGLGARDSLRLEAALPLHGHELGEDISALESGLGWIVKFDKGEFIGRAALHRQKEAGVPRRLVGFHVDGAGIARHGDGVRSVGDAREIGVVTSGTKTPTVNVSLGMALVASEYAVEGGALQLVVRGREIPAHVVRLPFYTRARL